MVKKKKPPKPALLKDPEKWRREQLKKEAEKPKPKKRGKMPTPGTAKGPELASLASLVVETETVEAKKAANSWHRPPSYILSLEWVNCGRCPLGHGPYWYALRREQREGYGKPGRLIRVYIGAKKDKPKAEKALRDRGVWK